MFKRTSDSNKWQLRWFVLYQNLLFYYENEASTRPSGAIFLEGCYCERLIQPGSRNASSASQVRSCAKTNFIKYFILFINFFWKFFLHEIFFALFLYSSFSTYWIRYLKKRYIDSKALKSIEYFKINIEKMISRVKNNFRQHKLNFFFNFKILSCSRKNINN